MTNFNIYQKSAITALIAGLIVAAGSLTATAATTQFTSNASYGSHGVNVQVIQNFLNSLGYLKTQATGNYLSQTQSAVKSFQKANGIPATGNFGPLTRAAANKAAFGVLNQNEASLSFSKHPSGSVQVGQTQTVAWNSSNYSAPTVKVNVIRKVSDNPARYELVRTISAAKSNNGVATWVPAATDVGNGVSLEIGCAPSSVACHAAEKTDSALAVVNTGAYANTAAAYQAIEQLQNK